MMILNNNEKFGNSPLRRKRSYFKNPHIKNSNHQLNNYLNNNLSPIEINSHQIQDNNINVQPSERDIIQILNSPNNIKKRLNRKESNNSLSISSDYVDYTLESSDNSNVIKPKSNKMFYLIIKYNNKVPDDQFRSGTYNDNKSMIVQLPTNNTEINSLKNPNT